MLFCCTAEMRIMQCERKVNMLSFSHRRFLTFAAAGALVFTAVSVPARAEELLTHLGPVGPNEPILTAVGSKRVIAFYVPNGGHCAVDAVVWENTSADIDMPSSSVRVRMRLNPGQMVHIDSTISESLNLMCGDNAASLAVVDIRRDLVASEGN
jgi:hypothetical protein